MGMFDNVKSDYDLPEALPGVRYQTKSFGDGYVGGFMDDYTITKEGKLIFHNTTYEVVPEEERPYWGKPEWKKNPLMQVCGSMRVASVKDEELDFHGIINIYTEFQGEWFEYEIKFTDGVVVDAKRIYREFGDG